MGKYSGLSPQKESSIHKPKEPHPIWRGIGCLMIVFIPAISIVIGNGIVSYALDKHLRLPPQLLGYPQLPSIVYKITGLRELLIPLARSQNLYAYIVASLIIMALISTIISFIYAVVYRMVNPYRYGPLDEPPSKKKAKKHSR